MFHLSGLSSEVGAIACLSQTTQKCQRGGGRGIHNAEGERVEKFKLFANGDYRKRVLEAFCDRFMRGDRFCLCNGRLLCEMDYEKHFGSFSNVPSSCCPQPASSMPRYLSQSTPALASQTANMVGYGSEYVMPELSPQMHQTPLLSLAKLDPENYRASNNNNNNNNSFSGHAPNQYR